MFATRRVHLTKTVKITLLLAIVLLMAIRAVTSSDLVTAAPPTGNQVSHWALNENTGTTTQNGVVGGLNGTFSSTPTWATGVEGSALSFNGTDSVSVGNVTGINGQSKVTLSAWMKRSAIGQKVLVGKQANNHDLSLELWSDGQLYFQVSNGSEAYGGMSLNDTNWHHIVLVFDGAATGNTNRLKGYVDGTQRTLQFSGTVPATTTNNTTPFRIGRVANSYSSGLIDDVWLYSRALSTTEVNDLRTYMNVSDTQAPTVPTNLTAGTVAQNEATMSWSPSSDNTAVTGYRIFRNGSQIATTTATNYQATGLTTSTQYSFTITAYDAANNESMPSLPLLVTTQAPTPAPTATLTSDPTQIVVGTGSSLTWTSQNATVCTASGGWSGAKALNGTEAIVSILAPTTFTLTCSGPGGQVVVSSSVTLIPHCGDGIDNDTDTFVDLTDPGCVDAQDNDETNPDVLAPSAPTALSASAQSASTAALNWTAATDNVGVTGYRIYRNGVLRGTAVTTTYQDTGLSASTSYSYTVSAYDLANNEGEFSNTASVTTSNVSPALTISPDGKRIIDTNGQPLFVNGDAAWSLFVGLNQQQVQQYLNDRQTKGFNLLMINVLEYSFTPTAPNNVYGQGPFTTPNDYATPNEAYFQNVDWVIQEATNRGFKLLLVPSYIGYGGAGTTQGWYDEMVQNGSQKMYDFGYYLGNRYKDNQNIIWANGGDWNPSNRAVVDEMAKGLKAADPDGLHTAHTGPDQNASTYWNGYSWLDIDNVYNYSDVYAGSRNIYENRNQPFFMLESNYENEHSVSQNQLRAQAYQSVLAGSVGHVFGNCPMWHFSGASGWCDNASILWQDSLNLQGSKSMEQFGRLFRSRDWASLVPDFNHTVLTSGYASGGYTYDVAARTANGNTVIVYYHDSRSLTFDMTKVSGATAQAWWFNPANGTVTNAGQFPTTGTRSFVAPSGNVDWVLVLDNASLGLPEPGQLTPDTTPPTVDITSPVNTTTIIGTTAVIATAADDRSVSSVVFALNGQQIGTAQTTAPYQVSLVSAGYANGTYALTATASDSSGNTTVDTISVTINNPVDMSAPTVSITRPLQNDTVVGVITLSANAEDDVSVGGVSFYIDGQLVGTEDVTAPYSVSWSSTSTANGAHVVTAIARDTSNKTTASGAVNVSVANVQPSNLLVALGFNNPSQPLLDSSTNSNNGSCTSCPVYNPTGGYLGGGAYNFAGMGNWIELPNEAQFDFTSNFTANFWMKTNAFVNAWEPFIAKGDSAWSVERNNTGNSAQFTTFSPGANSTSGSTAINNNQWHHVAIVYNGVTKAIYIDGVLNGSTNFTSSISNNNFAVRLGQNQEYSAADYGGWLDNVRIYNRALTAAEIVNDMNTPVN